MAAPIPLDAPVTTATFPRSLQAMTASVDRFCYRGVPAVRGDLTRTADSRLEEGEQVLVEAVLEGGRQAVRGPLVHPQGAPRDQLGRQQRRGPERDDLVVVPVD